MRLSALMSALLVLSLGDMAHAQLSSERLDAILEGLTKKKAIYARLTDRAVSTGAQNSIRLVEMSDQIFSPARLGAIDPERALQARGEFPRADAASPFGGARQVSDPASDILFTAFGGNTQSETSSAWCGSNVVIGFNDSGSVLESLFFGFGGLSFNGIAVSDDSGKTFTDLGFLDPGPDFFAFLAGDPVVACADAHTFYYASLFSTENDSHISVSKSTDAGKTFGAPIPAVTKPADTNFVDKPWMAVDPDDPSHVYVTYTDFENPGSDACGALARTGLEIVRSADGGQTWSDPTVLDETCGDPFVQGSQVVSGGYGEVYVAWEHLGPDSLTRELRFRKSTDHGASFGPIVKISDVIASGDGFFFQGNFRTALDFPSLAVDRSRFGDGALYIAWTDGRNGQTFDFLGLFGFYNYTDILMSRSTDGGATWSDPVRVNDSLEPEAPGLGTDQFQPGIGVDKTGTVGACWYDRRVDPLGFGIERRCARSYDGGATWTNNRRVSGRAWTAVPAQDLLVNPAYMGDYDTVATDFLLWSRGFVGAWGDNTGGSPDVKATRFGRAP